MVVLSKFERERILANLESLIGDRLIRHSVLLEQFKNGQSLEVMTFMNTVVFPELLSTIERRLERIAIRGFDASPRTSKRLAQLFVSIDEILRDGYAGSHKKFASTLTKFAKLEGQQVPAMMSRAIPIKFAFNQPSVSTLNAVVRSRPMHGRFLRDWYFRMEADARFQVKQAIQIGIFNGESPATITTRIRGTVRNRFSDGVLESSRRGLDGVVRTAITHTSNYAREKVFEANKKFINKVVYTATLDSRTTIICANLDGRKFDPGVGPRPPQHWKCRSTTRVELKPVPGFTENLPKSTRAALGGPVPDTTTYPGWLKKQPPWVHDRVLGTTRARLFRQGTPMDRFVNNQNQVLSLSELFRLGGID